MDWAAASRKRSRSSCSQSLWALDEVTVVLLRALISMTPGMTLAARGRDGKFGFLRETEPIFLRKPDAAERMFERCLAGRVDENFSKCEWTEPYAVEVEPKSPSRSFHSVSEAV